MTFYPYSHNINARSNTVSVKILHANTHEYSCMQQIKIYHYVAGWWCHCSLCEDAILVKAPFLHTATLKYKNEIYSG